MTWTMSSGVEGILPTCACLSYGAAFLALFACAIFFTPSTAAHEPPPLDATRLRPVVLCSIGWCALYFCFLQGQAAAAFWIHKKRRASASSKKEDGGTRDKKAIDFADVKYGSNRAQQGLILTMDRSVGNLLEQTPPFLLALWLHALTVSPHAAAWYGWLWLLLRASYPIAFAFPSMSPAMWGVQRLVGISWVSFVTWPSYFVVWMMLYRSSKACGIL